MFYNRSNQDDLDWLKMSTETRKLKKKKLSLRTKPLTRKALSIQLIHPMIFDIPPFRRCLQEKTKELMIIQPNS